MIGRTSRGSFPATLGEKRGRASGREGDRDQCHVSPGGLWQEWQVPTKVLGDARPIRLTLLESSAVITHTVKL